MARPPIIAPIFTAAGAARRSAIALLCLLQLGCSDTIAHWPDMTASERQMLLKDFTQECGLPTDRLKLRALDEVIVQVDPRDPYERVDCLLAKLKTVQGIKMGFVGNEAYVENSQ